MTLDIETLVDLYRDMWLIRAFEVGLEREFKKGNVPGMLHTGVGQEATQAALAAHLRGDRLLSSQTIAVTASMRWRRRNSRATASASWPSSLAAQRASAAARAAASTAPIPRSATLATTPWKVRIWPRCWAWRWPGRCARSPTLPAVSSATAPWAAVSFTRASTWPRSGSCRCSMPVSTTATPSPCLWARAMRRRISSTWRVATACPACRSTATTSSWHTPRCRKPSTTSAAATVLTSSSSRPGAGRVSSPANFGRRKRCATGKRSATRSSSRAQRSLSAAT